MSAGSGRVLFKIRFILFLEVRPISTGSKMFPLELKRFRQHHVTWQMDRHCYFLLFIYIYIYIYICWYLFIEVFFREMAMAAWILSWLDAYCLVCWTGYLKFMYYNVLQIYPKKGSKSTILLKNRWCLWLFYLFCWFIHGYPLISAGFPRFPPVFPGVPGTAAFIREVAQRKRTASAMGLVWPPASSTPGTPKTRPDGKQLGGRWESSCDNDKRWYLHLYIHTYIYIYIYTYIHTYIYIYT